MIIAIDIRETVCKKTGKGWYADQMIKALLHQDKKNEYHLYTHTKNIDFETYSNVTQHIFRQEGWRWHLRVRSDLLKLKPDLFWAPTSYIIPALAPKSLKTMITVHDLVAFVLPIGHTRKAIWLERLTLKRAVRKAWKIATVSENTKKDLKTLFEIPDSKVVLTPCAASAFFKFDVDSAALRRIKMDHHLPRHFILAVGTLSPRKNFVRLIHAFKRFRKIHSEYHLVIVGDRGWKVQDILKEAQDERIHLMGYMGAEELAMLYHLAEGFVFPSLYEGFGIPPLEAMACGCPVIASNSSSIPEVVGEAALLVDPYSEKAMAQAMEQVVDDAPLSKSLIEKGKERVKHFSWEKSAEQLRRAIG